VFVFLFAYFGILIVVKWATVTVTDRQRFSMLTPGDSTGATGEHYSTGIMTVFVALYPRPSA